jgi:UDP-glucose 4-epimerase
MVYVVIGGAGYLGSHITAHFLKEGYKVICVDDFSNSFPSVFNGVPNVNNLVLHSDCKIITTDKIDAIIQCGSYHDINESLKNPIVHHQNNINLTIEALNLLHNSGCSTFIYASTAGIYGPIPPIGGNILDGNTELDAPHPENPISRSHLICEYIIQDIAAFFPLKKFMIFRYTTIFGDLIKSPLEARSKYGHSDLFSSIYSSIRDGTVFKIQSYVSSPDGSAIRDIIHISDVIRVLIISLNLQLNGYYIFNIGSGKAITIGQILSYFKIKYPQLKIEPSTQPSKESVREVVNIRQAQNTLGWSPINIITLDVI